MIIKSPVLKFYFFVRWKIGVRSVKSTDENLQHLKVIKFFKSVLDFHLKEKQKKTLFIDKKNLAREEKGAGLS